MFEIQCVPGQLEEYILRDGQSGAEVAVAPERGGMVTRFRARGREVLYLDRATLSDRSKNVRGGIPVLFPIAGRLAGGEYAAGGVKYAMGQHGFARNMAFRVVAEETEGRAAITVALSSSEATRAVFPWDFEVRLTYALAGQTLSIEQAVRAGGPGEMPLHMGYHPYFLVRDADKARTTVMTDATRAFDNVRGKTDLFNGLDLTRGEVDVHLLDQRAREVPVAMGGRTAFTLEMDAAFRTLVVWTLAGKDFVCVEPWTAPGNALNTGEGLSRVPAGETRKAEFRIVAG